MTAPRQPSPLIWGMAEVVSVGSDEEVPPDYWDSDPEHMSQGMYGDFPSASPVNTTTPLSASEARRMKDQLRILDDVQDRLTDKRGRLMKRLQEVRADIMETTWAYFDESPREYLFQELGLSQRVVEEILPRSSKRKDQWGNEKGWRANPKKLEGLKKKEKETMEKMTALNSEIHMNKALQSFGRRDLAAGQRDDSQGHLVSSRGSQSQHTSRAITTGPSQNYSSIKGRTPAPSSSSSFAHWPASSSSSKSPAPNPPANPTKTITSLQDDIKFQVAKNAFNSLSEEQKNFLPIFYCTGPEPDHGYWFPPLKERMQYFRPTDEENKIYTSVSKALQELTLEQKLRIHP